MIRPLATQTPLHRSLAMIACVLVLRLIYVGQPDRAGSLQFRGFVLLPKGAFLTVLDYLTVNGHSLFVTNEITGHVYNVALRDNSLPSRADVSVLAEEPAAHGVIIDPSSRLAYVTRSGAGAVVGPAPKAPKTTKIDHLPARISLTPYIISSTDGQMRRKFASFQRPFGRPHRIGL